MKRFDGDKKYLYWGLTAFAVIAASICFYLLLSRWGGGGARLRGAHAHRRALHLGLCDNLPAAPGDGLFRAEPHDALRGQDIQGRPPAGLCAEPGLWPSSSRNC